MQRASVLHLEMRTSCGWEKKFSCLHHVRLRTPHTSFWREPVHAAGADAAQVAPRARATLHMLPAATFCAARRWRLIGWQAKGWTCLCSHWLCLSACDRCSMHLRSSVLPIGTAFACAESRWQRGMGRSGAANAYRAPALQMCMPFCAIDATLPIVDAARSAVIAKRPAARTSVCVKLHSLCTSARWT
jgi:hypothetical protein